LNKLVSIDEIAPIMKEQMEHGGKVVFTPKGNSMRPLFRSNKDMVTLTKPHFPLKKYSIIFYQRQNGQYVLHRLVGRHGQYYVMRGDNQYVNECNIAQEQIIAVVSAFQRNGKSYNMTEKAYKLYSLLWTNTMYIRMCYKILRRTAGKIKRKILRKK
jgi:hypothetical protein